MRALPPIAALAALSLVLGCAGAPQDLGATKDPAAARGRRLAQTTCAGCHAVEATGSSPNAKAPPFASLEMRHTASLSHRVEELTRRGHYEMPAMNLRPDEVADLVSYIASLEGR